MIQGQEKQANKLIKYKLGSHVGRLPNLVFESLLKSYRNYYIQQLSESERLEYFELNKPHLKSDSESKSSTLISYYDLLMAFAASKSSIGLARLEYHACLWSHSTLEARLMMNPDRRPLLRAQLTPHLNDVDLKFILKRISNVEFLDVCPCLLRNKSIHSINKYLNKSVRYLRLQNCCNWFTPEVAQADVERDEPQLEQHMDYVDERAANLTENEHEEESNVDNDYGDLYEFSDFLDKQARINDNILYNQDYDENE